MNLSISPQGWGNVVVADNGLMMPGESYRNFFTYQGETVFFGLGCEDEFLRAYRNCPPLKSIIAKRAKAFNNGFIEVLNTNTDNTAKGSLAKLINEKLKQPNFLQSGRQFFAQQNIYIDIFGYCPYIIIRPVGMPNEISSIWNIPPYLFDLDYTGNWLMQKKLINVYSRFYINWAGVKTELDHESVKFIFDDGIGTEVDTNLTIPDSRLVSLEYPVSNIIAAYKSRNTLITKRGAIGILSNDAKDTVGHIPMPEGEKDKVQNDFKRYGITGQPWQVIITDASLKWQQMGFATKDLLLFEEIEDDTMQLCDAYGYPYRLMASQKSNSLGGSDVEYFKKAFYVDTIIPESKSRVEQFSKGLIPESEKLEITVNYDHVDVLQAESKTKAEARIAINTACQLEYDAGILTKNQWLEKLGENTLTLPGFDDYKKQDEGTTQQD